MTQSVPADRPDRERGASDAIMRPARIAGIGMAVGPLRSCAGHHARAEQAA